MNPKQGGALTSSRRKDSLRRSRRVPFSSFGGERALDANASIRTRTTRIRNARCNTASKRASSSPIPPDNTALFLLSRLLFRVKTNDSKRSAHKRVFFLRELRYQLLREYSFCIFSVLLRRFFDVVAFFFLALVL